MSNTQDIIILDIEESQEGKKEDGILVYLQKFLTPGASIKLRQKVIFFRILATMVNASLTVLKSLTSLKKQEKDPNMVKFYTFMIDKIQ
ncbi:MAG: hypothetical protein WAW59_01090 [Patescibacteria group bacterium]